MEVNLDAKVYDTPMVCIIEAMGRHAGWLTAAAAHAKVNGLGADLIYLPEVDFDIDKFVEDVKNVCAKNGNKCIAVVSEGIHNKDGQLICESFGPAAARDSFGHAQLGGVASILANLIKEKTGFKTRGIELSLMQRCGAHLASKTDVEEAFEAGAEAVRAAVRGETDKMVIFERHFDEKGNYYIKGRLNNTILGPSGENIYPEEIEQVINNIEGVEESLVMERDGKLVALVKFTDNALDWDQATEDKWFEELEARKKAILDWVNKTVGKNSKIGEVDAMKEPFEKTATQKIRRFKYKNSHGDEPEKPEDGEKQERK